MRILNYIRDTRGEMKHVSWPTRKQALGYTVLVILLSILTAFYLGIFDFIFSKAIQLIV